MKTIMSQSHLIDQYIKTFDSKKQLKMNELRMLIKNCAPLVTEIISYQMPTFYLKGIIVHFAAYQSHLGFYPGSEVITLFKEKLGNYHVSKGTIQFKWDDELPLDVITQIVKFRVQQNLEK
jgi:uncharacterized protein YdhG (YjbR/CyaY superfamily)